jgi:hypothetical protein
MIMQKRINFNKSLSHQAHNICGFKFINSYLFENQTSKLAHPAINVT